MRLTEASKALDARAIVVESWGHHENSTYWRDRGSFTLTSGVPASEPMPGSAVISLVNAGLEGFVRAAALEVPRGIRVNVVSPPWVSETLRSMGKDPAAGMPAEQIAAAYAAAVEGQQTGQDARDFKPK